LNETLVPIGSAATIARLERGLGENKK
jgi:hypothetical protein